MEKVVGGSNPPPSPNLQLACSDVPGMLMQVKASTSKPSKGASPPNWLWFRVTFNYRNPGDGANS